MPNNKQMSRNHISNTSSLLSKSKIETLFSFLEHCRKSNVEATDELIALLESDNNLLTFKGSLLDFKFEPISRNTVRNHGKLPSLQAARKRALKAVTATPEADSNSDDNQVSSKKETKATLKAEKDRLKDETAHLKSELASLRSAYRELLKHVECKLPSDPEIAKIVDSHKKYSVLRDGSHLRVVK